MQPRGRAEGVNSINIVCNIIIPPTFDEIQEFLLTSEIYQPIVSINYFLPSLWRAALFTCIVLDVCVQDRLQCLRPTPSNCQTCLGVNRPFVKDSVRSLEVLLSELPQGFGLLLSPMNVRVTHLRTHNPR